MERNFTMTLIQIKIHLPEPAEAAMAHAAR
jgi:hypothetical protein